MRWRAVVVVCLLAIAISLASDHQESKDEDQQPQSSIARAKWQDVQQSDQEREKGYEDKTEETDEQYEQRRVRVRNGPKRRRRLRKRPRTTTPPTTEEDEQQGIAELTEEQFPVRNRWSQEDSLDYPPVDGDFRPYRRRPGKRRRRPLRKQSFMEQPGEEQESHDHMEDGFRRRRKGYRKRIRPLDEYTEEGGPQEDQERRKTENTHETLVEFKPLRGYSELSAKPVSRGEIIRQHISKPTRSDEHRQHISKPTKPDEHRQHIIKQITKSEEHTENTASIRKHHLDYNREEQQQTTTVRSKTDETQTHHDDFKQLIKTMRLPGRQREKPKPDPITVTEKKEIRDETTDKVSKEKEKVFDRKVLFSKSRRLPQTSAIIRRRLIQPKNDTLETLVPKGYDKQMPEVIPPYKLIEEIMSTRKTTTEKDSSEEPNYPKIQPKTRVKVSTSTTVSVATSPYLEDPNMYTTIGEFFKVGKEPLPTIPATTTVMTTTTTPSTTTTAKPESTTTQKQKDSSEKLNVTNVEDHILDLLLTKNGSSRLAKILELRNMSLIQLLQHRERGSSQLHFSEVFTKQNGTTNDKDDNSIGDIQPDKTNDNVTENVFQEEGREPRIFESLPDFDKNSLSETRTQPYPTWSVIPNPDLTPESVRKSYQDAPIITRATIKPLFTDNIEEIVLIENNTVSKAPGSFHTNFANRVSNGIKTFKKFPPGVKSAIIVSLGILVLAIIGFLSVLISCRVRQKRSRLRAKRDVLNEQLHAEEFMNSQRSLSPVLNKNQPTQPSFTQGIHSNTSSNRHYYLWRTLRKTFQYD